MTPQEFLQREEEVQAAHRTYPDMEMGEAYMKWKIERGEESVFLNTWDTSVEDAKRILREGAKRPCTQGDCKGTMELETICAGCVEGRKGYKTKWTCAECLHRELSKKDYWEWLKDLTSQKEK